MRRVFRRNRSTPPDSRIQRGINVTPMASQTPGLPECGFTQGVSSYRLTDLRKHSEPLCLSFPRIEALV